jgi:hypothetical protein
VPLVGGDSSKVERGRLFSTGTVRSTCNIDPIKRQKASWLTPNTTDRKISPAGNLRPRDIEQNFSDGDIGQQDVYDLCVQNCGESSSRAILLIATWAATAKQQGAVSHFRFLPAP